MSTWYRTELNLILIS